EPISLSHARVVSESQYDGDGERVVTVERGKSDFSIYVRDLDGTLLSEYKKGPAAGVTFVKDYVYGNSELVAMTSLCGPAPTLTIDTPPWSNGNYRFRFVLPMGGLTASTGYLVDVSGPIHNVVSLPPTATNSFTVPDSLFAPNSTNVVRLQSLSECGGSGYSN